MRLLLLGAGKTGSLVAEVARERGHSITVLRAAENAGAAALTPDTLRDTDAVIDFTTPHAVLDNITACLGCGETGGGKPMVVGTTGWYEAIPAVRALVEKTQTGFVFGANFSIGVNLFLEIARVGAAALQHGYAGQIFERHHVHKKDAPSGTAIAIRNTIHSTDGRSLEITSFREGDVVGMHEVVLDSPEGTIYLCHDAKSRRGFAEGAVRAAEWIADKKGFYDFKDIWRNT
jgi:4-hydroxy-tetrahydrodipicolinate reductase